MNGNKIFSCHHPFFGLVQATPFCLKKVVCERMTPRLLSRALTPPPIRLTHFLLAFLHIHVCLNADGIKRILLPHSISVFLFYLLLQVEGICGMHAVLDCPAAVQTNTSPPKSLFVHDWHPFCVLLLSHPYVSG